MFFFSLSDPLDKVKKLFTPGCILRSGIKKDEYDKLSDKRDRRKKRSLRMFVNNQKTSPVAITQA